MICPLMSKPIKEKDHYGADITEFYYTACSKENCALWIKERTTGGEEHCGLINRRR